MDEKLIRTFLSIPVPDQVKLKKNMLYSTLEDTPAKIAWVKSNNLHLTIKFIGYTPESFINKIIEVIKPITYNHKPFSMVIENTGCFPIPDRPRVLWMGVTGNLSPLLLLVSQIEEGLLQLGFPKERIEFKPHITLARIKYPQKYTPDIDLFLNSSYDPIDFSLDRVQFFSSELLPSGAVYTLLQSFPLGESI